MEKYLLAIFDEIWPLTMYYSTEYICTCVSEKIIKIENSLLAIFYKIWPKSLYYSTGTLGQNLNNNKNS